MAGVTPLEPRDPARIGGYVLVGRLGEGGQGTVYLGRGADGTPVAVKVLHPRLLRTREDRRALANELTVAQHVAPFCIAQVLDADLDSDTPYVVSEYVEGPSLAEAVRDEGPRAAGALHRLAVATITALVAIHEAGIVHRDFKPHNVLLGPDGPRVIDFGIARVQEATLSTTGRLVGTPAYMAPEQASGQRVGPAADVFAWGGVMAYAALGRPAFGSGPLPVVLTRIVNGEPDLAGMSGPVRALVEACLVKDPAGRPSAHDVLMSLVGRASPLPETMRRATDLARPAAPSGRDVTLPPSREHPGTAERTVPGRFGGEPGPRDTAPHPLPPVRPSSDRRVAGGPDEESGPWQDGSGATDEEEGHRRRWGTPTIMAAFVLSSLLGLGALVVLTARDGYYVGADSGRVVLYRGTPQKLLGASLSRRADPADQPNPPIMLSDLPQDKQESVRRSYTVKGPKAAVADLTQMVCRYTLTAENGQVAIVQGVGRQDCRTQTVLTSTVAVGDLPLSDQKAVRQGTLTLIGRAAAVTRLNDLERRVRLCKQSVSAFQDCPTR